MSTTEKLTSQSNSPTPPAIAYIDPACVAFRTESGRLQMRASASGEWLETSAARLFPLSEPEDWLSIADRDGKEIGIVLDMKRIPNESAAALREELRRRYLIPQILRVISTRTRFDLVEWTVETDRGRIVFLTRRTHETTERLAGGRIVFTDASSNRYDIPNLAEIDPDSRRMIEERL